MLFIFWQFRFLYFVFNEVSEVLKMLLPIYCKSTSPMHTLCDHKIVAGNVNLFFQADRRQRELLKWQERKNFEELCQRCGNDDATHPPHPKRAATSAGEINSRLVAIWALANVQTFPLWTFFILVHKVTDNFCCSLQNLNLIQTSKTWCALNFSVSCAEIFLVD